MAPSPRGRMWKKSAPVSDLLSQALRSERIEVRAEVIFKQALRTDTNVTRALRGSFSMHER